MFLEIELPFKLRFNFNDQLVVLLFDLVFSSNEKQEVFSLKTSKMQELPIIALNFSDEPKTLKTKCVLKIQCVSFFPSNLWS